MLKAASCSEGCAKARDNITCRRAVGLGLTSPCLTPTPCALHPCLGLSLCSWAGALSLSAWEVAWPPSHWTHSKLEKPELARGRVRDRCGGGEEQSDAEVWNWSDHPRFPPASGKGSWGTPVTSKGVRGLTGPVLGRGTRLARAGAVQALPAAPGAGAGAGGCRLDRWLGE